MLTLLLEPCEGIGYAAEHPSTASAAWRRLDPPRIYQRRSGRGEEEETAQYAI